MKHNNSPYSQSGFSLIEMAMVMLIMGILLSGLFVSIGQSTTNIRINTTKSQLKEAQEALYGFAQLNGRLPCPSNVTSRGKEALIAPDSNGECTAQHGLLPNVTLGLSGSINSDGLLLDAWNNPMRYSVTGHPIDTGEWAFTSSIGVAFMFATPGDIAGNMLSVCSEPDCDTPLIDTAPAVIFSMGANWPNWAADSSATLSPDEQENSDDRTNLLEAVYPITSTDEFVSAGYSEENFDDIVVWLSPHILFSRLIKAGRLPL